MKMALAWDLQAVLVVQEARQLLTVIELAQELDGILEHLPQHILIVLIFHNTAAGLPVELLAELVALSGLVVLVVALAYAPKCVVVSAAAVVQPVLAELPVQAAVVVIPAVASVMIAVIRQVAVVDHLTMDQASLTRLVIPDMVTSQ
jgi:hypothetical protein